MSGQHGDSPTAVVTGSSRGIGKHIAEKFGKAGYNVVVCALESERSEIQETARQIDEDCSNSSAIGVCCDVTDRESVASLADRTRERFGTVDVLVNNAGGGFRAPFESIPYEKWRDVIELNLDGVFNCTQILGKHMCDRGSGTVLNIASQSGLEGNVQHTPYCAAKAGVVSLTKTLAFEWAKYNVRVNAIAPGLVATPLVMGEESSEATIGEVSAENIDRGDVCRRVGHPDEIADVAVFLASQQASYITGETISAAGVPRLERVLEVYEFEDGDSAWIDVN